ncbi:MAG TPA: dipeptidase [Acidimicrobiales bacterium]|nr:dipeptidase [Acidimicrobiales bacterium]
MVDLALADYVATEKERIIATLFEWLRIPSISAHPARAVDVVRSARFVAGLLEEAGLEHVEVLETAGAPAVYGDWLHAGAGAPTVVVYGHHDVQPADPEEAWTSPPFEPVMMDGECRARGAVDDKGQVLYEIEAARGLLRRDGRLPVNIKFLIEGEEEVGSPHFEALLEAEAERLRCDAVVVSDTTMWAPEVPSVCMGMRGLAAFDLVVRTATSDLHSGSFGGSVPNPVHLLAGMVAALHDDQGKVTLPGFYDDIRPLTPAEHDSLGLLPFDDTDWKSKAGVQLLAGEAGHSTLERVWTRPTCEVVGFTGGYGGDGVKTIVPASANAKITFRLVADQDPGKVAGAFRRWVDTTLPEGVRWELTALGAVAPALTPAGHPAVGALCRAIERVWGTAPLFTREGGSGPEEALGRVLGAPVLYLGIGLPDDRFHAPNERLVMDQFWKGLLAAGELWLELGAGQA